MIKSKKDKILVWLEKAVICVRRAMALILSNLKPIPCSPFTVGLRQVL